MANYLAELMADANENGMVHQGQPLQLENDLLLFPALALACSWYSARAGGVM